MLRFMIPLILFLGVNAKTVEERSLPYHKYSAATDSQIKFAIENKYDDTGPGAKKPDYAYKTYKTLDEALVAYLDDPDTKLPEHERAKAIQRLVKPANDYHDDRYQPRPEIQRHLPKTVEEYTGLKRKPQKEQLLVTRYSFPEKKLYYDDPSLNAEFNTDFRGIDENDISLIRNVHNDRVQAVEPYKLRRIQKVKTNPLSLAHYTRDPEVDVHHGEFNPHPQYTFSYGVHDKHTGDSKSAHETRDGDSVRGYYTFIDADGKQRTVHYTADEKTGFRATVQRSQTNAQ